MKERLSIIVPVLDEAPTLAELVARIGASCRDVARLELVFVDDASTDGTFSTLRALAHHEPRLRAFRLGRNLGSQQALLVGLERARGELAICLDADLQQPPEVIPQMLAAWRAGAQVVHMVRGGRGDEPLVRSLATRAFYSAFNLVNRVQITPDAADFKLLDRACIDQLVARRPRFLRAAVHALEVKQTTLTYAAAPRLHGASRYGAARLLKAGVEAFAAHRLKWRAPPAEVVETIP